MMRELIRVKIYIYKRRKLQMKESHVFDPKNVESLEAEDRKIWQNL